MTTDTPPPPPAHPIIHGEQIFLRPAERSDLDAFIRWFNDAETRRHLAMVGPMGRAAEERWFEGMLERQGKRDYHFVICLLSDGRAIGTAGLHEIDLESGSAAFGISIGEEADRGRGYGTDALQAICDFGFGELALERIWLDVYAPNLRGQRSYQKAGFVVEGTMRHARYHQGEFQDVLRMSMLRDEWLSLPRRAGTSGVPVGR
jgi:ribosomal-protein-alanine N-acetyltransferase